jgi:hypothetical protein
MSQSNCYGDNLIMGYLNFNDRSILAARVSAIVCTASPVWAHAPEYHAPSAAQEASTSTDSQPTPESETTSETTTCTTKETCGTDPEPNSAEKKSAYRWPIGEFVLVLLAAGPFIMVEFKQRWQHHHQ